MEERMPQHIDASGRLSQVVVGACLLSGFVASKYAKTLRCAPGLAHAEQRGGAVQLGAPPLKRCHHLLHHLPQGVCGHGMQRGEGSCTGEGS